MASPSSPPPPPQDPPNWLDLPPDVSASILRRLGAVEILTRAQLVCSSWRHICRDPSMWRSIDMRDLSELWNQGYDLDKICRHAVDRSCGGLLDINIEYLGSDDLLRYIAHRSRHLRCLRLVHCDSISDVGLIEVAGMIPVLEELDISYCEFSSEAVAEVGRCCPLLSSFKLNNRGCLRSHLECDDEAFAIARNMPGLHHLQLFGNKLTNEGLSAIVDGCPLLESLDLRQCFNVDLDGNLGKRCAERIKDLRRPYDSTDDYPFDPEIHGHGLSDDDDPYMFSDIDFMSDDGDDEVYEFSGGSDISDYGDIYFDY